VNEKLSPKLPHRSPSDYSASDRSNRSISPSSTGRLIKVDLQRVHRPMRGIFLFELALLTPMVILAATSLFDITTLLRTKNALKEAAQASIRCLTTEGSLCSTTIKQTPLTPLYSYYRQTTPPPLFGNLRQVPVRINERVSPLQRYQFDATVLDAVYTGAQQTQYEEVSLTRQVTKVVPYVLQSFPYFVMPNGPGNYDIFGQPAGQSAATADREVTTFGGAVTKTTGRSVVFWRLPAARESMCRILLRRCPDWCFSPVTHRRSDGPASTLGRMGWRIFGRRWIST
jgi:hypothetical protein